MDNRIKKLTTQYRKQRNYISFHEQFISERVISKMIKINVFKAVLTFGCQSWMLTKRLKSKKPGTEMKYLKRVRGVTKIDS